MKKKRLFSWSVFVLFFTLTAYAQTPGIKFERDVHDFDLIQEDGGMVTTTFEFINDGDAPLIINEVTRACGCTTPDWTREPVPVNGKGFIQVSYNPKGRPGAFTKEVTVKSNAPEQLVLRIKGEVIYAGK